MKLYGLTPEEWGEFLVKGFIAVSSGYAVWKSKKANANAKEALRVATECTYPLCGHVCGDGTIDDQLPKPPPLRKLKEVRE